MSKTMKSPVTGVARWLVGKQEHEAPLSAALLSRGLYNTDPVRTGNRYPRQRNYHGWYAMASTGAHVWFESLLEMRSLMLLDHGARVVGISSQPVELRFGDHQRYPDFLALHADGTQRVYDVKPRALITDKVSAQFTRTAEVCTAVGWEYRVLTDLPAQARVNLTFLASFRHPAHHPGTGAVDAARAAGARTVAELVRAMPGDSLGVARAHALHLLWTREFPIDLTGRLTSETPVRPGKAFELEVFCGAY